MLLPSALAALVLAGGIAGCGDDDSTGSADGSGSGDTGRIEVVASTDVYGSIVQLIAGDDVRITSIISNPDADPHSYEASPKNQLALSKADIVIENGGGYDDFIDSMLKSADNEDATVLNVVDISGYTAPADGELNEHVWYDFGTVAKLADRLVDALSELDPDNADSFTSNAAALKTGLEQMQETESTIEQAHSGAGVAITEPVPVYLLEACGLVNKTPEEFSEGIEEGTDIPPAVLQETLDLFTKRKVELLAYNEQTSGPETEKVLDAARSNEVAVVPFTETLPAGTTYLTWMQANLSAIQTALGG